MAILYGPDIQLIIIRYLYYSYIISMKIVLLISNNVVNIVPNDTGPVSHDIPKNYSHSASNSNSLQSSTLGIEANVELNLTDNEKPLPLELLSASATQVSIWHTHYSNYIAMYMHTCHTNTIDV